MTLSWTLLIAVLAGIFLAWFWYDSMKARERANQAAEDACGRAKLQFLDGTVAFARLSLTRSHRGYLALRRTYVFDYTAPSIERQQGFVVLCSGRIETVGFAAQGHRTDAPQQRSAAQTQPPVRNNESNVLDLEQWRRQHRSPLSPPERRRSDSGDRRV